MKIAFFSYGMLEQGGGLEKYFVDTAAALAKTYPDLDISIITFDKQRTESLQRVLSFYYFKEMPLSSVHRETTENILSRLGCVEYVKCPSFREAKKRLQSFDVIYTKNELLELGILKSFGYRNLPPVIVGMHTPVYIPNPISKHDRLHNFLYMGFLYKFLLKGAKIAHVINGDDLNLLRNGFGLESIQKILLPFHLSKAGEQEINFEKDVLNVLFVGRLTAQKGIDILLDCIETLAETSHFESMRFRIAGSGELDFTKSIQELTEKYGNIKYFGHVPNDEMKALYRWADAVIIPSRWETANYVALEAGSSRRVVVASDIPGPREVIENGETGFLVSVDPEAFSEKLLFLFDLKKSHPEELLCIGERAREYIGKKFDPDSIYGQFREMLDECASLEDDRKSTGNK